MDSQIWQSCFNPRTHIGCDASMASRRTGPSSFNPRTHIGCDMPRPNLEFVRYSFNPRTHIGCDFVGGFRPHTPAKFQSTHPHRVRRVTIGNRTAVLLFQSTHPHRVRRNLRQHIVHFSGFNPRTHIGCDLHFCLFF